MGNHHIMTSTKLSPSKKRKVREIQMTLLLKLFKHLTANFWWDDTVHMRRVGSYNILWVSGYSNLAQSQWGWGSYRQGRQTFRHRSSQHSIHFCNITVTHHLPSFARRSSTFIRGWQNSVTPDRVSLRHGALGRNTSANWINSGPLHSLWWGIIITPNQFNGEAFSNLDRQELQCSISRFYLKLLWHASDACVKMHSRIKAGRKTSTALETSAMPTTSTETCQVGTPSGTHGEVIKKSEDMKGVGDTLGD